jgi:BirA family transcriptional regulator, biotin operon repressor / biotin---[acetyl-CoA-carboxylase] ligase
MAHDNQKNETTPSTGRIAPSTEFSLSRILSRTAIRHVEHHSVLASTSDTARELLPDLLDLSPSLVLADTQVAGRGRQGKSWLAAAGALTFSVVLDADATGLEPKRRSLIAIAAGAAVHDVVANRLPRSTVRIKWPNDVLIGGQKACGVLIEQHAVKDRTGIVIGVGLNVNNSFRDAGSELHQTATSLFDVLTVSLNTEDLLIDILDALMQRLEQLRSRLPLLMAQVNAVHALSQRRVTVDQAGLTVSGRCQGIDDEGCLVLQRDDGSLERLRAGTVVNHS